MIKRLLKDELSLSMLSNQGFERSHLFHHSVFNRTMNNGGGRKKTEMAKQLLLWQWRKVFLALSLKHRTGETYWGEKRLVKEYKWDPSKVKKQLIKVVFGPINQNYSYPRFVDTIILQFQ